MSTQQLDSKNFRLFEWRDDLVPEDFVFVDYYVESLFRPELVAYSLAQEQSLTATAREVLKRDVDLSGAATRVYSVDERGTCESSLMPFYLLSETLLTDIPADLNGPYHCARVTLAFPTENLGSGVTDLWNSIYGELPRHGILNAFRVLDVRMPEWFLSRFQGPAYGVQGLRNTFGIHDRPFLCRSMQPAVGLTTEHMLEIDEAVLRGGFDLVKDDELSHDSALSPIVDRFKRIAALVNVLCEETGEPKRYIANIIANPLRSIELLSRAESAGAHAVLVAPFLQGLGFVSDVRSRTSLPIMAHNTGDDTLTRQARLGVHPSLLIKLYRLCGADIVMLPGAAATAWQDDTVIRQCLGACFDPIPGIEPVLPVLAGGKSADRLADYRELVGSPDFMLIVASALNEDPAGLAEGAAAFRRAWDKLQ